MNLKLKVPAQVIRVQNLANGTVRLVVDLQDVPAENAMNIAKAYALREIDTTLTLEPTEISADENS